MSLSNAGSCGDGCEACPIASAAVPAQDAPYTGAALGWMSVFYFFVPIVFALIGAAFGAGIDGGALGGFGGLIAGVVFCAAMARRWSLARIDRERCERLARATRFKAAAANLVEEKAE